MTGELTEELFSGFRKIESEYYKHPAQPADTRRFNHFFKINFYLEVLDPTNG